MNLRRNSGVTVVTRPEYCPNTPDALPTKEPWKGLFETKSVCSKTEDRLK